MVLIWESVDICLGCDDRFFSDMRCDFGLCWLVIERRVESISVRKFYLISENIQICVD